MCMACSRKPAIRIVCRGVTPNVGSIGRLLLVPQYVRFAGSSCLGNVDTLWSDAPVSMERCSLRTQRSLGANTLGFEAYPHEAVLHRSVHLDRRHQASQGLDPALLFRQATSCASLWSRCVLLSTACYGTAGVYYKDSACLALLLNRSTFANKLRHPSFNLPGHCSSSHLKRPRTLRQHSPCPYQKLYDVGSPPCSLGTNPSRTRTRMLR